MIDHEAQCSCGQLRAVVRGEPFRVSICHCLACQRRTGSAFGTQARFEARDVEITGEATEWSRTGDEGSVITQRFCPRCGATVWYDLDTDPGIVAIPVGAFADPDFPAPRVSVYEERRHRWVRLPDTIEHRE